MKYFLPILLVVCVFGIALSFNDVIEKDHPQFRYHTQLIDTNYYSKDQCWQMVQDKFNLKIKNGKVEF